MLFNSEMVIRWFAQKKETMAYANHCCYEDKMIKSTYMSGMVNYDRFVS